VAFGISRLPSGTILSERKKQEGETMVVGNDGGHACVALVTRANGKVRGREEKLGSGNGEVKA